MGVGKHGCDNDDRDCCDCQYFVGGSRGCNKGMDSEGKPRPDAKSGWEDDNEYKYS